MSAVFPGRFTAKADGDFVVFLIGMRINRFWALHKWLPVARAMGPMLRTLQEHPEKGFLSAEGFFNGRIFMLVQYWRSYEDLETFARNPSDPHLAAWQAFHKAVGDDGSVGIWHETYPVAANGYECIYGNMPRFGLANAFEHLPITPATRTARQRMGRSTPQPADAEDPSA